MKTTKAPAASRLELKKQNVRNLTVSSGVRTGCDAGCSNGGSGCTNNTGGGSKGCIIPIGHIDPIVIR